MGDRLSGAIITAAVAAAAISTVVATPITQTFAQTPAAFRRGTENILG
jgi:hypothetical protein